MNDSVYMRELASALSKKYESNTPPDDWPCYGDAIHFVDECNGMARFGIVHSHHMCSPVGAYKNAIWNVDVGCNKDKPELISVKYREITKIIRQENQS